LTTLQDDHVDIKGQKIRFQFRGKSGVEHDIEVNDRRLAKIVKRCQDLPGQDLFQYLDDQGQHQTIGSGDVNDYLREIAEQDFTAKDFRTWAGTLLAALELEAMGCPTSDTQTKKHIVQAIKNVAQHLGNRPATCRKYYIHPAVLDACTDASLYQVMAERNRLHKVDNPYGLRPEERAVVAILEEQLKQQVICQQEKLAG
ncbi:MAG: DNA topoisomerase IB, partial [Leptolyngbyaceae cyanobacterium bins.59]|nr:DNA topoisomerase IB [Leptolyngbyaceae cyanobacterium bins.59]